MSFGPQHQSPAVAALLDDRLNRVRLTAHQQRLDQADIKQGHDPGAGDGNPEAALYIPLQVIVDADHVPQGERDSSDCHIAMNNPPAFITQPQLQPIQGGEDHQGKGKKGDAAGGDPPRPRNRVQQIESGGG